MMTTITPKPSAALFDDAATIAVSTSSSGSSGIERKTSVKRISQ
jgi:hypothetical protein